MTDDDFLRQITAALADLPGVDAVALGGSRAHGTARADSDWDLAVYYRDGFDPQSLRDVGWAGEVSDIGGWGGGVFNGGAWLTVEGRRVDVHYRDLNVVEAEIERARRGKFDIQPLMFHLAGIPTYLVVAELALGHVLCGALPTVGRYPDALRRSAAARWAGMGDMTLSYAEHNHAIHGRAAQCLGLVAVGASQFAHAVLARRGEWITNEKRLLGAAGLDDLDRIVAGVAEEPASLLGLVTRVRALVEHRADGGSPRSR